MPKPRLTIGFVPRERFSLAADSLASVLACADLPFDLVIVNPCYPERYWRSLRGVLDAADCRHLREVTIVDSERYLLPNASRNRVLERLRTELVLLAENDNLFMPGFAGKAVAAADEERADAVTPLLVEGSPGSPKVHFDDLLGEVDAVATADGEKLRIRPREQPDAFGGPPRRTRIRFVEQHCNLFRSEVFERAGPYDERLNTRDEIDLSLSLRAAGAKVVRDSGWIVHYVPPFPPAPDELDYFRFKWDIAQAARSREIIAAKWNLMEVPGDLNFVRDRNLIGRMDEMRRMLEASIPAGERFVLIDGGQLAGNAVLEGLHPVPFVERDGAFWGNPADDPHACRELARLEARGVRHVVLPWTMFWFLDVYPGLMRRLSRGYTPVVDDEAIKIWRLARPARRASDPERAAGPPRSR